MSDEHPTGALTVSAFCEKFNVGGTFVYQEIKSGRLSAVKAGSRTLILVADAERWAQALPKLGTANAA